MNYLHNIFSRGLSGRNKDKKTKAAYQHLQLERKKENLSKINLLEDTVSDSLSCLKDGSDSRLGG